MGKLIIPKNSADRKDLDACFDIYFNANDWVTNEFLIDKMKDALGLPHQEPQAYTKKTQILAYYGFIEWEDKSNSQSRRKITESGVRFYNAIKKNDENTLFSELINTLETLTFGRNVCGCDSDSNFEPPQIFIRYVLALDYLTYLEFGYVLLELEENNGNIFDLLTSVATNRITGKKPYISNRYSDPKVILALINWGFLKNDGKVGGNNKIIINPAVLANYADQLQKLRIFNNVIYDGSASEDAESDSVSLDKQNVIYYGSPGTGKSHTADLTTNGKQVQKVTFHPDYDYHSFVGGYKPTMVGDKIAYKFVPQIFTKIYVNAWGNLISADETQPFYLQIEEINRGNCAEIFGDLFQLLDRDQDGFSKYEVTAEEELCKYLLSDDGFGGEHPGIEQGKLRFPNNLKIIATMNTSDQSLFPMDSAFKRRWEWIYVPIDTDCIFSDFTIQLDNGKAFKWLSFLKKINKEIVEITKSQDKQIGNWFINAHNYGKVISESMLVNKVIFYLWTDVFKDEENTIFKTDEGENLTYTSFFEKETSINLLSDILEKRLGLIDINKPKTTTTDEE
jgi:hypothetical protein